MIGLIQTFEVTFLGITSFLLNYWIHSCIFVLVALAGVKLQWIKADSSGEIILKSALVLGLVSALLVNFRPEGSLSSWQFTGQAEVPANKPWRVPDDYFEQRTIDPEQEPALAGEPAMVLSDSDTGPGQSQIKSDNISPGLSERVTQTSQVARVNASTLSTVSFWVVVYWLCGVVLMLALRTYQRYQLNVMMEHRTPLKDVVLMSGLASLKQQANYTADIRLFSSGELTSPIVLNQKEIVLPEIFVTTYSSSQQQAALAHELAHLKRHDTRWQMLHQFLDVLFFFQPLNKLLRKELNQVVEQRADQMGSLWTGNPRALAEALSVTAKQQLGSRHSQWVLAMKCEKSNLLIRVENLLKGGVQKTKATALSAMILSSITLVFLAPGITFSVNAIPLVKAESQAVTPESHNSSSSGSSSFYHSSHSPSESSYSGLTLPKGKSSSFHHMEDDDGATHMKITNSTDDTSWSVEANLSGKIRFNDTETSIDYFPPDSKLVVKVDDGIDERKLTVKRHSDEVHYRYYKNRREMSLDDDIAWYEALIPELLRTTGWYAEERVRRILEQQGVRGVLDEIKLIVGDHGRARYLNHLSFKANLTPQEVEEFIAEIQSMGSDHESSRVMIKLMNYNALSKENWLYLLAVMTKIESDMELSNALEEALNHMRLDDEVANAFFETMETIESDFQLAQLLAKIVKERKLPSTQLSNLFITSTTIQSDFELASLLITASSKMVADSDAWRALFDAAMTIQSDFEMRRLFASMSNRRLSSDVMFEMLAMAANEIQSDNELGQLLTHVMEGQKLTEELILNIREALESIQSSSVRNRVEGQLNRLAS